MRQRPSVLRQGRVWFALVCLVATAGLFLNVPVAWAAGPPLNVFTDPAYGDVGPTTYTGFIGTLNPDGLDTAYLFQYGRTVDYGGRSPSKAQSAGASTAEIAVSSRGITGLRPASVYHYRLMAANAAGTVFSDDRTFTTCAADGCVAPAVTGEAASGVTPSGATLNAAVNPNGGSYTICYFTYSTDPSVTTGLRTTPGQNVGHANVEVPVAAAVAGLTPGTTYYFVAACQNDVDQTQAAVVSFTTEVPAVVTTGGATTVTSTSATLGATLTGARTDSTCRFDYGRSVRYGGQTAGVPEAAGAGGVIFSGLPSQLAADALYHYRAKCSAGPTTTSGAERTFTTRPASE